jgi:hypothetical protein
MNEMENLLNTKNGDNICLRKIALLERLLISEA